MALNHKWNVKNDFAYELQFFSLISDGLGNVNKFVKVTQINYVSRNQLQYTANLNFGLMGKKAKHCWAVSTIFSV